MGRSPCCDKNGLKKGPWTPEEDEKLICYIQLHGPGNWRCLPKNAGLQRCGKSCRLRWTNYLRPDIKRGRFSFQEEETIIQLHSVLGNKWSAIAAQLPGRTDNEIKNYWNTHIRKRLLKMGIDPVTHSPRLNLQDYLSPAMGSSFIPNNLNNLLGLQAILNPELFSLFENLISAENQQNPETQLPNLIDQNQFQLPTSTVDHHHFSTSASDSIPAQTQTQLIPNPNQYPNIEGCDMGQPGYDENWLNTNQSGLGFDCFGSSTQLNFSCNTEDYGSSLNCEVPAGCLNVNGFL